MPKPVKGFITDDGSFFKTKEEAALHEAIIAVRHECSTLNLNQNTANNFMNLCESHEGFRNAIFNYIKCFKLANPKVDHQDNQKTLAPDTVQSQPPN